MLMRTAEPLRIPDSGKANRLVVRAGAQCIQGARRENNEDHEYVSPTRDLFIVADGMGGHAAGEVASKFAVDVVSHDLARIDFAASESEIEQRVREALNRAHCMIVESTSDNLTETSAGSTVVLALLRNHRLFVTGVGDSRAYLIRDGAIQRLTVDDTYPDALLEIGQITVDEAHRHRMRNYLLAALGMRDYEATEEQIRMLDVYSGDRYLLASDGLTDVLDESRIHEIIDRNHDPQSAAEELTRTALSEGGGDDITCIVFHVAGGDAGKVDIKNRVSLWRRTASILRGGL